ncbi:MAG: hypothetical protein LKCHEGNO_01860 [Burkholderiaceae bacterium]|nr:hypothetical protein [Burkholderiaceae bacterium]
MAAVLGAAGLALWMWLLPAAALADAPPRGRLGFTVYVEVEGNYAKPILKSVRVQEIEPGSPAEKGGLQVEDLIVQAQGRTLSGANARDVAAMVQVPPGHKLRLLVRSIDGALRRVTIVAGPPVRSRR